MPRLSRYRPPRGAQGPLARIRVYPEEGSSLYALAVVWPTVGQMRAHLRKTGVTGRYAAINRDLAVHQFHPGTRPRKLGIFSEVHFPLRHMGGGVVAHEFFHTTAAWARRIGLDAGQVFTLEDRSTEVRAEEERLCMAHGRMVSQFINRAWKLGLYK